MNTVCGVVLYNTSAYELKNLLDSFVLHKSIYCQKIVLLNNCSTLPNYQKLLNDITSSEKYKSHIDLLVSEKNLGFGGGHNYIFKYIEDNYPKTSYYCICNPDIVLFENSIKGLVEFMDNDCDVGLTGPKVLNDDLTIQYSNRRFPNFFNLFIRRFIPEYVYKKSKFLQNCDAKYERRNDGYDNNNLAEFLSGCFLMIRCDIYRRVGGFDERFFLYMEDADLCRSVNSICKVYFVADVAVKHTWKRSSHKSMKSTLMHTKSVMKYFAKHGWFNFLK